MVINQNAINQIKEELEQYKKLLAILHRVTIDEPKISDKKILSSHIQQIRSKIKTCEKRIELERAEYNYTAREGYAQAISLSKYLGKEVKSPFRSDKGTPQLLMGIVYSEGDGSFSYTPPVWSVRVRYWSNGKQDTGLCPASSVNPVK